MGTLLTQAEEANLGMLGRRLDFERFSNLWWTRFTGDVSGPGGEPVNPGEQTSIPDMPVIFKREFSQGNTFMKMPLLRRLTQVAKYGNDTLVGKGENQNLHYQLLRVNQRRGAVMPPTYNDQQILPNFIDLVREATPQIRRWLTEHTDFSISKSFYEGWSPNVRAGLALSGLNQAIAHHPNLYAAASGKIAYNANQTTYGVNIHNAVNAYTGLANEIMSVNLLRNLVCAAYDLNIPPMVLPGSDTAFYPVVIDCDQRIQLSQDPDFKDAFRQIPSDIARNPVFKGVVADAHIEGCVVFTRNTSVFGVATNVSGVTTWGPDNALVSRNNPLTGLPFDLKAGMLLGAGAIAFGQAKGPEFTEENLDHKNFKEIGIRLIDGMARVDNPDVSDAPTETLNQSSLSFITHSPQTWA